MRAVATTSLDHSKGVQSAQCSKVTRAWYRTVMLWTILIILAIVALVLFILGYRRTRV